MEYVYNVEWVIKNYEKKGAHTPTGEKVVDFTQMEVDGQTQYVEWAKIRDTGRKSPNVRNKMLKGLLEMENNKGINGLSSLLDKYKVKF